MRVCSIRRLPPPTCRQARSQVRDLARHPVTIHCACRLLLGLLIVVGPLGVDRGARAATMGSESEGVTAVRTAPAAGLTPRLLAVRINGNNVEQATRLLESPRLGLLVSRAELGRWGLVLPSDIPAVAHDGKDYYPLQQLEGLEYSIDRASQLLVVQIGPRQLTGSRFDLDRVSFRRPQAGAPGGFVNYELMHEIRDDADNTTSGTFELAGFNRWGLFTTTVLATDQPRGRGGENVVRLNTTFRHDQPDKMRTLTLGDSYSRPGTWGRSVLYGGIQWGSNFGTRPDFTTFPLPDISGEAIVPSSVEIYANDRRRAMEEVDAGPFSLRNIPVVTGANDLRMTVTDVLGREQVIEQPFYASQQLLRPGLHDYSYELGAIRKHYSQRSNEYGRGFAAATHRLGFTDRFTGGARLEALKDQQTAGVSGTWLAHPRFGTISGSLAGSTTDAGKGALASLGIEHRGRLFSFAASTTATTADFRQLGLREDESAPRWTTRANIGARLPGGNAVSLSYSEIDYRDQLDSRILSASYRFRLSRGAAINLYASQELESHDHYLGLTLSMALGGRNSASVSHRRDDDSFGNRVDLQRSTPRGSGLGYRLSAEDGQGRPDRGDAQITARTDIGTYRVEAAHYDGDTGYRLNARGGIALLGGNAFATRQINDSFGVVRVGEYPDVTVYNENQPVATTNRKGAALVPDLRSFETNRLGFEQDQLPLDARIDRHEEAVVPGYRRGVLVDFDVGSSHGALLTVHLANGEPLPAGATIRHAGSEQRFPVARRGEAWVTDLKADNQLVAQWGEHRCHFEVSLPADPGPMPRIGPLVCQERP